MERFCVFGAGAVGGYLAAHLARAQSRKVCVIARGPHLAAIKEQGLRVQTSRQMHVARPWATDDPSGLGPQDAVVVAVKAPSLPSVAAAIAPLLGPDTPVVFVGNGIPWWYFHKHGGPLDGTQMPAIDPNGALWRTVGPQRAIGAVFGPACRIMTPGMVRLTIGEESGTILGEPDGQQSPRLAALAQALRDGGLPVVESAEIRTVIWRKLAFVLSADPLVALAGEDLTDGAERIAAELTALAAALGIVLGLDVPRLRQASSLPDYRPGILHDLDRRRPMEIDSLFTQPLDLARTLGVETPALNLLASAVKARARAKGLYGG